MTMTVVGRRGKIKSAFRSDAEAIVAISKLDDKFAKSLYSKRANLSVEQLWWVHKLATDSVSKGGGRKEMPTHDDISWSLLKGIFDNTVGTLKHPKITINGDHGTILVRLAGQKSRRPGTIQVSSPGRWEERTYYGYLDESGFHKAASCTQEVLDMIRRVCEDPTSFAANYGKKTGVCCFCNRHLTDQRSVVVGYGPICANHYGLPWGKE